MTSRNKIIWTFGLFFCAAILMAGGLAGQEQGQQAAAGEEAPAVQENVYEGVVKTAFGKYLYLPSASGFDIVVQGGIQNGDATTLVGKDIRVKGELLIDKPSIFRADSVDLKDSSGQYANIFTRSEDLVAADYLDSKTRDAFQALTITSALKNDEWEGKGQVKVFGKLQATTAGGQPVTYIILADAKGREIGKVIVDSFTDYAQYYLKKLRLFDEFWFYLNVKETVDKRVRTKSRELFHADIVFCGLY